MLLGVGNDINHFQSMKTHIPHTYLKNNVNPSKFCHETFNFCCSYGKVDKLSETLDVNHFVRVVNELGLLIGMGALVVVFRTGEGQVTWPSCHRNDFRRGAA